VCVCVCVCVRLYLKTDVYAGSGAVSAEGKDHQQMKWMLLEALVEWRQ
jgi:hypothetical protein